MQEVHLNDEWLPDAKLLSNDRNATTTHTSFGNTMWQLWQNQNEYYNNWLTLITGHVIIVNEDKLNQSHHKNKGKDHLH